MTLEEPPAPSTPEHPCCDEFARRISDLHDGRWPAGGGDCAKVEEHLATCPRCAELLDDYRLISKAAEALRGAEVSEDCAEVMRHRVRARLRRQVFRRRLKWTGAGLAVAAAASVAIAVAMLPDADPTGPGHPEAVASGDDADDRIRGGTAKQIDILRNPAVIALLKELREEALRDGDLADALPEGRMTIQEEIDLRHEWGVFIGFPLAGHDLDGFSLPDRPRDDPLIMPRVMPVGGNGR